MINFSYINDSVSIQSLVVAAAFRLRQATQAEACDYQIPPVTEGLHDSHVFSVFFIIEIMVYL